MNLLRPPGPEIRGILAFLPGLIDKTFPLPGRFRAGLARGTAELSRLLTGGRTEREKNYLEKPERLSAYLRYFLPWNVCRLSRLLPNLPLELRNGDRITDLGAGPLTFAVSLWISRPELRKLDLEFRCVDRAAPALEAGKRLFAALTGVPEFRGVSPWRIKTIRGSLDAEIRGGPAALVTAVNVYNEVYEGLSPADRRGLEELAAKSARRLASLAEPRGAVLVVEPGIPRSGEFIAALRGALMETGRFPRSPCTHRGACPFPGTLGGLKGRRKERWCRFAFTADEAPAELLRLSGDAGIPKERLSLSFLLAGGGEDRAKSAAKKTRTADAAEKGGPLRIISDSFPLPGGLRGRYGCGAEGLFLLRGGGKTGARYDSGSLLEKYRVIPEAGDAKSGAVIVEAEGE
ncbi:MAG: rRNA methyltransferase [Treponema sp.]|jgi:hypothetical protein|nr:rRNA methyltransferase [Treponema sp.]